MIDLNVESLYLIGLTPYLAQQLLLLDTGSDDAFPARIIEIHRDQYVLHDGKQQIRARHFLAVAPVKFAVGDWIIARPHENNCYQIINRIEPVTQITRRDHAGNIQLLVSNIDTALLVMGLDNDFNLRRMERYLAIVQSAQVTPVIVLTKKDLVNDVDEKLEQISQRLPSHISAFAVNALEESTSNLLSPWLKPGQTLVLLGSSGAGKSTLTNALTASQQITGAVRENDSRGRHTTTSRSLHRCTNGACIIDTPGLRTWSPDVDEGSLDIAFEDIATLATQCKFRNCQHLAEPGCAVRGRIDDDRLLNYQKLLREIKRSQQTALERIEERAKWKTLQKIGRTRGKDKRR